MASQWRIRHKLMLGLFLVVGIMALLLVGTLRGLWSYYATMNNIRGKETELKSAEALKESVANLRRLLTPEMFDPGSVEKSIKTAQDRRDDYDKQFEESARQGYYDSPRAEHVRTIISKLHKILLNVTEHTSHNMEQNESGPEGRPDREIYAAAPRRYTIRSSKWKGSAVS